MSKLDGFIQEKQQRAEDWKAQKEAEREELNLMSDDGIMSVTSQPEAYLRYLEVQADHPQYSATNILLVLAQNPEITQVNSLERWNKMGRTVKREENGLKIRVSDRYVKDGREYRGYKVGRVFDVSQTTGKSRPPNSFCRRTHRRWTRRSASFWSCPRSRWSRIPPCGPTHFMSPTRRRSPYPQT